ncbi:MAG: DUF2760 domain-containing protein [Polyangiaceae bacterium]
MSQSLPFGTRLWFSVVCAFRLLFDGAFAGRVWAVKDRLPELESGSKEPSTVTKSSAPEPTEKVVERVVEKVVEKVVTVDTSALQILAALQREGRFLDFVEEDIQSYPDADIGAAARVVHAGCRKVIREHAPIEPVRAESEGASVTIEAGFEPSKIKLTGDIKGSAPYRGTLRHRGWRVRELKLPTLIAEGDTKVLAAAEVELS